MSKYIELAKKLKILAEKGVDGEKVNAQRQLDELMKKYDISVDDLERNDKRQVIFDVGTEFKKLFVQVGMSIVGKDRPFFSDRTRANLVIADVTRTEEIEIRAKFGFYKSLWSDQLSMFWEAFVYKNSLLPPDAETLEPSKMTAEEINRALKVMLMQNNIDRGEYLKQLKD